MTQYNMYEAKTNLSKISKMLEDGTEDVVIISRNGEPVIKMTKYDKSSRKNFFGCGKGLFEVPEDFDDMDLSEEFKEYM